MHNSAGSFCGRRHGPDTTKAQGHHQAKRKEITGVKTGFHLAGRERR